MSTTMAFVNQLYSRILGRTADAEGLRYWIDAIDQQGQSAASVTQAFLQSPEYQSITGAISRLYQAILGRSPDESGLDYWVGEVQSGGQSLAQVASALIHSAEAAPRYQGLNQEGFIEQLYQTALARPADAEGKAYWLNSGLSQAEIAMAFAESAELKTLRADSLAETDLFHGILGRSPDNSLAGTGPISLSEALIEALYQSQLYDGVLVPGMNGPHTVTQTPGPTLVNSYPIDNALRISSNLSQIVLEFSEDVSLGDAGMLKLVRQSDHTVVETFDAGTNLGGRIAALGSDVVINIGARLTADNSYYLLVDTGFLESGTGQAFSGINDPTQLNFRTAPIIRDTTAPRLQASSPSAGETGIALNSDLVLTFGENILLGNLGFIEIYKQAGDILVERIDLSTAHTQVSVSGTDLTINPTTDLLNGTAYYVKIGDSVVRDLAGNYFAGIQSASTLVFTTIPDTTAPVAYDVHFYATQIEATSTEDGAMGLYTGSSPVIGPQALTASTPSALTMVAQSSITQTELIVSDLAGNQAADTWAVSLGTAGNETIPGSVVGDWQIFYGFGGNDTLGFDNGVGLNIMFGGTGDDSYEFQNGFDSIVELAGEGTDTVYAFLHCTLPDNVENLVFDGNMSFNGTGNELANTITGNDGWNTLSGLGGADTITGGYGVDTIDGGDGDDRLIFLNNSVLAADALVDGGADTDTLEFTSAIDTLSSGNFETDLAQVTHVERLQLFGASSINIGAEFVAAGIDTILTGASDTQIRYDDAALGQVTVDAGLLADNKTLTLTEFGVSGSFRVSTSDGNIDGSALSSNLAAIASGTSAVSFTGGSGLDQLTTAEGNDTLIGNLGVDLLEGGLGADQLSGGGGSDQFLFNTTIGSRSDSTLSLGYDRILDLEATDTIKVYLFNVSQFDASSSNYVVTNRWAGQNLLILNTSGTGDDGFTDPSSICVGIGTYNRTTAAGQVRYVMEGTAGSDSLIGGSMGDTIFAGEGDDAVNGGAGGDSITLGLGLDTIVFSDIGPMDAVMDYNSAFDQIQLSIATFSQLSGLGTLSASEFESGAFLTAATTSSARIIYNTTFDILLYDADGAGGIGAIEIAQFIGTPNDLTASEITVIA